MSMEKGKLACVSMGAVHLLVGVLLVFRPFLQEHYYLYVTATMLLISGVGSVCAFVVKSRSRFRPGWLLPQGIMGLLLGIMMLIVKFSGLYDVHFIYNEILAYFALITAILHISAAVQIKCLGFPRWWILLTFGIFDLFYGVFVYFYMIQSKKYLFGAFGIFLMLLSLQFFAEPVLYKIAVHRDNSEFNGL